MKVTYITVDGLLDPLGQAQIIPYLLGIKSRVPSVSSIRILSIEKKRRIDSELSELKDRLKQSNIEWEYSKEHCSYFSLPLKVFWLISRIRSARRCSSIFHLRGFQSLLLFFLSMTRKPFIYDVRGILGEFFETKRFSFPLIKIAVTAIDKWGLITASHLVFLDQSALDLTEKLYSLTLNNKSTIIPTAVDRTIFKPNKLEDNRCHTKVGSRPFSKLRFVYLGGARDPYRPDLAIHIVNLFSLSVREKIEVIFINEFDVEYLKDLCEKSLNRSIDWRVISVPHLSVPNYLANSDFGLICNEPRLHRATSCPTKLGEFLSCGLSVVALAGIHCIDRLSQISSQISVIDINSISRKNAEKQFVAKALASRQAGGPMGSYRAGELFCLSKAIQSYGKVYQTVAVTIG